MLDHKVHQTDPSSETVSSPKKQDYTDDMSREIDTILRATREICKASKRLRAKLHKRTSAESAAERAAEARWQRRLAEARSAAQAGLTLQQMLGLYSWRRATFERLRPRLLTAGIAVVNERLVDVGARS